MAIRSIQFRLFGLLLRAFLAVVLLTFLIVLGSLSAYMLLSQNGQLYLDPPLFTSLETYYLARGSWDEVESIFTSIRGVQTPGAPPSWNNALLLDVNGQIVAGRGQSAETKVKEFYTPRDTDFQYWLRVNDEVVGRLIIPRERNIMPWHLFERLLGPVAMLSIFPGILTILIGVLLTRRMIYPLADVIAASQSVAAGNLATRVMVRGPQDLHALTGSFNHMADALQRSDAERRNMLADVAHELRTPLSVIRGRLEGMVDGVYSMDETHIAQALEQTYQLERLVDDLRLLTLAETRQLPFDRRLLDLGEMAQRAADLFEAEAAEKNITLQVEIAQVPTVLADPQRIEQVIGNLIGNALHYTPDGGQIILRLDGSPQAATLAVSDNGPGVPEADWPHIFDRFWRSDKSRARQSGGAGLGLAISRQLVEAQGGKMFAYNCSPGGLTVGFNFPPASALD